MAMKPRRDHVPLVAAAAFAVLMPLALLLPGSPAPEAHSPASVPPLGMEAPPAVATVYERPLFGAAPEASEQALPGDAPALVGVVGRLGSDAVALVRTAEGTTRTLSVGESVDGWQLASLAIDAAFFTRGAQRVRVPLPTN